MTRQDLITTVIAIITPEAAKALAGQVADDITAEDPHELSALGLSAGWCPYRGVWLVTELGRDVVRDGGWG